MVELVSAGKVDYGLGEFEKCDDCGGRLVTDIERGEYVCAECGVVMDSPMLSNEVAFDFARTAPHGDSPPALVNEPRPSVSLAVHDFGISSEVGWGFRDASGNLLHGRARYRAMVLRRWQSRTRAMDYNNLSLAKALSILNVFADQLELPQHVREEASSIYRKVAERQLTKGRSKSSLVAVCLYVAIRRAKLPFGLRDVLPVFGMRIGEFNLYLNAIKRGAGIEVPPPDPAAWIPKVADLCNFSAGTQLMAVNYLRSKVKEGEAFGMSPHIVAAISLYRMGALNGEFKNVHEIARKLKCAADSILKGFVSESAALRNHRKAEPSKIGAERHGWRSAGQSYMRKNREGIDGVCSISLYRMDVNSRVKAQRQMMALVLRVR
jgi:transcription initiation factor TFIIB